MTHTALYRVKSIAEIHTQLRNISTLTPVAGATRLYPYVPYYEKIPLPDAVLFLKDIPEMEAIIKRERFIDFGAAATLEQILKLGRKNLPFILYEALCTAACPNIRAAATIGGNIAHMHIKGSMLLPLIALEAKIEVRTQKETLWLPLSRCIDENTLLTDSTPHVILRVRIPLEAWDISYYKRLGPAGLINGETASFIFLARTQKNTLSDIKVLFANTKLIKKKEFENILIGRSIPIERRLIKDIIKEARIVFADAVFISDFEKQCFFNLIKAGLYQLS